MWDEKWFRLHFALSKPEREKNFVWFTLSNIEAQKGERE
jgi:hypothetical protein